MCERTEAVLAVRAAAQDLRSTCLSRLPVGLPDGASARLPPRAPDLERLLEKLARFEIGGDAA